MTKVLKEALILLRNNAVILQPLLLGYILLILSGGGLLFGAGNYFGNIFSLIVFLLMACALCAGWFSCVKAAVEERFETSDGKHQIKILKSFFPGVSEYFIPVILSGIIYLFLFFTGGTLVSGSVSFFLAKKGLLTEFQKTVSGMNYDITEILTDNISNPVLLKIFGIFLAVFLLFLFVFSLITLWVAPILFYKSKNPLIVFIEALKFLSKNFRESVFIVLTMFFINILISVLNVMTGKGLLSFIPFLLAFFYVSFYALTVFLYYAQTQDNYDIGADGNG